MHLNGQIIHLYVEKTELKFGHDWSSFLRTCADLSFQDIGLGPYFNWIT